MTYDVLITQLDLMALFDVKGTSKDVARWCGDILPDFPAAPLTFTCKNTAELMWLAPDHWILRAPLASEADLLTLLKPEEAPDEISVVQVSDTLVFFSLQGADLTEILSVVTPLDIHPSKFPRNSATFSEAFGVKALFLRKEQNIEIGVERSFGPMIADYLQRTVSNSA